MVGTDSSVVMKVPELSALEVGREAVCFAALAQKAQGTTRYNSPYWKCGFKDRYGSRDFFIWSDDPLHDLVPSWSDGEVFRLRVRAKSSQKGIDLKIVEIRPAGPDDVGEGYNLANLYETSKYPAEECTQALRRLVEENVGDPHVQELVRRVLDAHEASLCKMPAAQSMHHAFTGGLIEHIRSMARVSAFLANHYAKYYDELDPPLNKDVIVAAAILHDIGKLFELEYHPVSARYTTTGRLVGHIVLGRDLVRQTAQTIEGFPSETLLQLEHAILAHHGRREYGAVVLPQTLEALIVAFVDDLDSKVNQMARARIQSRTDEPFTDAIPINDDRRPVYKGVAQGVRTASEPESNAAAGPGALE